MDEKKSKVTVNFNLPGLLLIAFIILKLCGVIQWSWLWVLAPLWIPLAIWLVVVVIILFIKG